LVVECSILVELVVCGGFAQKLVVHGRKCNYPKIKNKKIANNSKYKTF